MNAISVDPVLSIKGLTVSFSTLRGRVCVIDDLHMHVNRGEILGIVGESGSGKSVTFLAAMGLLGAQGQVDSGAVLLDQTELTGLSDDQMRRMRGVKLSMIFQEPMTSLNPLFTVGFQVAEVFMEHLKLSQAESMHRACDLLEQVSIPAASTRLHDYPFQLSGGMRQRVMIAMALALNPQLLVADEPTTALDVTVQAQILELMRDLRMRHGTSIALVTHDMGVIAQMADRVVVMYAGQVVEEAPVHALFAQPLHPYTRLLLCSIPSARIRVERLPVINGAPVSAGKQPSCCRFHPRCPDALPACAERPVPLFSEGARSVRCLRVHSSDSLGEL